MYSVHDLYNSVARFISILLSLPPPYTKHIAYLILSSLVDRVIMFGYNYFISIYVSFEFKTNNF